MTNVIAFFPFLSSPQITHGLSGYDLLAMPDGNVSPQQLAAGISDDEAQTTASFARELIRRVYISNRDERYRVYWREVARILESRG